MTSLYFLCYLNSVSRRKRWHSNLPSPLLLQVNKYPDGTLIKILVRQQEKRVFSFTSEEKARGSAFFHKNRGTFWNLCLRERILGARGSKISRKRRSWYERGNFIASKKTVTQTRLPLSTPVKKCEFSVSLSCHFTFISGNCQITVWFIIP